MATTLLTGVNMVPAGRMSIQHPAPAEPHCLTHSTVLLIFPPQVYQLLFLLFLSNSAVKLDDAGIQVRVTSVHYRLTNRFALEMTSMLLIREGTIPSEFCSRELDFSY